MSTSVLVLSVLSILFNIVSGADWSYKNTKAWVNISSTCGGKRQSPINFSPLDWQYIATDNPPVTFESYDDPADTISITNTGHTVRVNGTWPTRPSISFNNDLLEGSARFFEFHIHWSESDRNGSEHRIWGKGFAMELHAVHLNNEYSTNKEALKAEDGVIVFGRVFGVTENGAGDLDDLTEALQKVQKIGSSTELPKSSLRQFGIDCPQQKFLIYEGSLTTPPCTENVDFMICEGIGTVSRKTIDALRKIQLTNGDTNNVRPTQKTGDREEYLLFARSKPKENEKKED